MINSKRIGLALTLDGEPLKIEGGGVVFVDNLESALAPENCLRLVSVLNQGLRSALAVAARHEAALARCTCPSDLRAIHIHRGECPALGNQPAPPSPEVR